jgi:uncharacterized membrane protein
MIIKFIHLLTMVIWFGGMIFFSFIAAPSIFKILPKTTAGDLVGDIFPKYYLIGYIASLILLGTLIWLGQRNFKPIAVPLIIMAIMTGLTYYSGMVVGAKARAIKTELHETQDEVKKEKLAKSFKKIHGISMMLNVSIIALSIVYLAFIPVIFEL